MSRSLPILLLLLTACSIDDDPAAPPPKPELKTRILDRMGRAAVNTALNNVLAGTATKGISRDAYNRAAPEAWPEYEEVIASNLAVYDALDGTCGNQLLAGPNAVAGRYAVLAGALADDRLYLNTAASSCTTYLAVELGMNEDCGGRTLLYDTIDVTYSALSVGSVAGVGDGVASDEEAHALDTFPFLAAP